MGMGRDHPRAAGGMGLCKSKLPEVGRPLRPQEKGNVAGAAGSRGGGEEGGREGHEGGAGTPHPRPVCTRPAPHPPSCTCSRISRALIRLGTCCAGFWALHGEYVTLAVRPPGDDSVDREGDSLRKMGSASRREQGCHGERGAGSAAPRRGEV